MHLAHISANVHQDPAPNASLHRAYRMLLIYNFESTKKVSFIGHKNVSFSFFSRQYCSSYSLSARTIVTTLLLTAKNGASHFMSGSGSTSTQTLVNARKVFSGYSKNPITQRCNRQRYEQSPANFISIGQNLYFNLFAFESRCCCFRHCRLPLWPPRSVSCMFPSAAQAPDAASSVSLGFWGAVTV